MSEMLGNQYFLARKYHLAARELEAALANDPENKEILRKLVICHVQSDEMERALILLWQLVQQDLAFLVSADPLLDDCPCPELVYFLEKQLKSSPSKPDHYLKLAILWLYCDIETSLNYFRKYQKESKSNVALISKIIERLTEYQLQHHLKGNA